MRRSQDRGIIPPVILTRLLPGALELQKSGTSFVVLAPAEAVVPPMQTLSYPVGWRASLSGYHIGKADNPGCSGEARLKYDQL
jgi:hypothetical protein